MWTARRLGGGRLAEMLDAVARQHAQAGVEPRHRRSRSTSVAGWQEMPDTIDYPNGFRAEWELFLRHLVGEVPDFRWNLEAGARGVQLAEAGLQSWPERRWIDLPALAF